MLVTLLETYAYVPVRSQVSGLVLTSLTVEISNTKDIDITA
jgi:hypothetical protein